jgi:predicted MPP superfamily phosphohydrolase
MSSFDDFYWTLCQYPWHYVVNISMGAVFFLLSVKMRLAQRTVTRVAFLRRLTSLPVVLAFCDIAAGFILLSLAFLAVTFSFLLRKGLGFAVIGYTTYFWLLFFPVYILFVSLRSRSMRLTTAAISSALILVLGLSHVYFPQVIHTRNLKLTTAAVKKPFRIVHLSDLQAERYGGREAELVEMVNVQKPDLVLVSGDLFSKPRKQNKSGFDAVCRIFTEFRSRHGIVFVEGHHDWGSVADIPQITGGKSVFLSDQWHSIVDPDAKITIYGAWPNRPGPVFFQPRQATGDFVIYLEHTPVVPPADSPNRCDLCLFGHTHGGQVYVPWLSKRLYPLLHGRYDVNGTTVIVNSGIGMEGLLAPRIRWLVFPEIVVIDLLPQQ